MNFAVMTRRGANIAESGSQASIARRLSVLVNFVFVSI